MHSEQKNTAKNRTLQASQRKQGKVLKDNRETAQRQVNHTGLPDELKNGMENLSGQSLDHVKVHYNSDKPASVGAHAYAQGSNIHLASGQEKHLPHELGHVVQQIQGRVQPTTQIAGMPVNEHPGLEKEADRMGAKALQRQPDTFTHDSPLRSTTPKASLSQVQQRKAIVGGGAIDESAMTQAMVAAARQKLISATYYSQRGDISTIELNEVGKAARTELLQIYDKKNVRLANKTSLMYQVIQDLNLKHINEHDDEMKGNSKHLMGLPHQHVEYTSSGGTPKEGNWHWNQEMRVYRDMPKFAWEQKKLRGHGGSIGQAMHYFNRDQKTTNKNPGNVYYLVEFVIPKHKTKSMVSAITGGGEGEQTSDSKFGGKNENNTFIGLKEGLFSVDLGHAADLLKATGAISCVIASTDGILPSYHTAPGKVWSHGSAQKPQDWVG